MQLVVVTGCKSRYDAALSENPAVDEKRVLIDILAMRETLNNGVLRWVPTHLQFADSLTKLSEKPRTDMMSWLRSPYVQLTGELKAKKKASV